MTSPDIERISSRAARCAICRRDRIVRTYEWEVPVQVIECCGGIRIVGVDYEAVPQHVIVDYRHTLPRR
jgi:hypothetical protein